MVQREHIQRVYLPQPQRSSSSRSCSHPLHSLQLPMGANRRRQRYSPDPPQGSAVYSTSSAVHQMHWGRMVQAYAISHPLHPSPCRSRHLGPTCACACEVMGPRDMGEGNMVDLGEVCWCLRCRLGVEWGPRCSSASVPVHEGGIPGVCGGVGGGKGALQVVGNFWPSLEMGTEDAESLPEFR